MGLFTLIPNGPSFTYSAKYPTKRKDKANQLPLSSERQSTIPVHVGLRNQVVDACKLLSLLAAVTPYIGLQIQIQASFS